MDPGRREELLEELFDKSDEMEAGAPTPGTAEGEPDGNDPHEVGPGGTPGTAEGDVEEDRPLVT